MNWIDYYIDYKKIKDIYENYKTPDGVQLLTNQNNDLAHIFGTYYLLKKYPQEEVENAQKAKENWDITANWLKTIFTPRVRKMSRINKKADSVRDLINDKFGIDLYNKKPNMTDKEVMDYVYNNYLKQMKNIFDGQKQIEKNVTGKILNNNLGK